LADALTGLSNGLENVRDVDFSPLVDVLQNLSVGLKASSDRSNKALNSLTKPLDQILTAIGEAMATAEKNADRTIKALQENTEAQRELARILSQDKAVDYDAAGRPVRLRLEETP
jgi:ABC-type transporter Mla subunit MlaD